MKTLSRDLRSRALHEIPLPIPYDAAAMPGARVLGNDGREYVSIRWPTSSAPYAWRSAAQLAEDIAADVARVLTEPVVVTVGSGGDYATLSEAMDFLARFFPGVTPPEGQYLGEISILSGTELSEQVFAVGARLGWVRITSEDAEVVVDTSGFDRPPIPFPTGTDRPFMHGVSCDWPAISTIFRQKDPASSMNTTGIDLRASNWSTENRVTVADAGEVEALTLPQGFRHFALCGLLGGGSNFRLDSVLFEGSDRTGPTTRSLRVQNSTGVINNSRIKGDADVNMQITEASRARFVRTSFRREDGVNSSTDLVRALGSIVQVGTDSLGGYSAGIIPNTTLSAGGIVFDSRVTSDPVIVSDSNSDGNFTRFASGLQICVTADVTGVDVNIAAGNIFRSTTVTVPMPAAFSSIASMAGSGVQIGGENCLPPTLSVSTGASCELRAHAPTSTTVRTFRVFMSGRWK